MLSKRMETMTDTENAFATAQYEPIPAAARDFVKKAAATAKERATTFHADADKTRRRLPSSRRLSPPSAKSPS